MSASYSPRTKPDLTFGVLLAAMRRHRRYSQVELAARAGLSQRHLSFLETGRSQPGPHAINRLVDALALDQPDITRLLAATGLYAVRPPLAWADEAMAEVRGIVGRMLNKHEPYPGIAYDRSGAVLQSGDMFERLITTAAPGEDLWAATCGTGIRNLYDLSLHPAGIVRYLTNPSQVIPPVIRRIRHAASLDRSAEATLRRVQAYPAVIACREAALQTATAGVVTEIYRLGGGLLRLVSMTSTFGSPEELAAQSLQIELFFPADVASDRRLHDIATSSAAGRSAQTGR
jgi:transcriptional regulator with XRE-family HTH domain